MKPLYFQGAVYFDGLHIIPSGAVEITAAEFKEFLNAKQEGLSIGTDAVGKPSYSAPARAQPSTEIICTAIDAAADAARLEVAGDPLRAVEYERAAAEAQAFKDAGYAGDVPRTVAAWAINGRTAQQAADSILAESAAYTEALYCIRETRLQAKELVRQAMDAGNTAQAQDVANEAIATIEAMVAGVGNNPA